MSALPPKADIARNGGNVRFVPKADSCTAAKRRLFNHLVSDRDQRLTDCQPECLGGPEVDDQVKFDRLHDWQFSRFLTFQDKVLCR
jgi:hypothetical protein